MKILDAIWFSQMGNSAQIGIVIGEDQITKEIKSYIGTSNIGNEDKDRQFIAATGAKFPVEAAKALFWPIEKNQITLSSLTGKEGKIK